MDLWHYPTKTNKKPGVMELWDFPNGKPMEQNTIAEETRLITRDIVAITKNLDDAYDGNDIRQTLNYLATADNGNLQFAYNILKQLVESHLLLEYQLNKATKKIEHQQQIIQQVQPELTYESEYESEYSEVEEEEEEDVITTNIPFFVNPPAPVAVANSYSPSTSLSSDMSEDMQEANGSVELVSSESEQDEVMSRYQNLMFEDDFAFKPRLTRNNSQGANSMHAGEQSTAALKNRHKHQKRLRRKYEESVKEVPSPQHMKKLARVKSNPNARRFRQKKSYLTRREQWNMEFSNGSPKNSEVARGSSSSSSHKASISLDSTSLGLSTRPILDMNRNIPLVISTKRTSPDKNADSSKA